MISTENTEQTFEWQWHSQFDKRFQISLSKNPIGAYFERKTKYLMHHPHVPREKDEEGNIINAKHNAITVPHPSLNNVIKSGDADILMKGTIELEFNWRDDENITEEDLIAYENFLMQTEKHINCSIDLPNKKFKIRQTASSGYIDWSPFPFPYVLNCDYAKITAYEEDTEVACVLRYRKSGDSNYRVYHKDYPHGEYETIYKNNEEIYLIPTDKIVINDFVVQPWNVYKIDSSFVRVSNTLGHSVKIIKIIK